MSQTHPGALGSPRLANLPHFSPALIMHQWGPLAWPVPSYNLGLLGGCWRAGFGPISQARWRDTIGAQIHLSGLSNNDNKHIKGIKRNFTMENQGRHHLNQVIKVHITNDGSSQCFLSPDPRHQGRQNISSGTAPLEMQNPNVSRRNIKPTRG